METKRALQNNPLEADNRIMESFYKPSETSQHVNLETNEPKYKRQTYHMSPDQVKKIKAYAFYNEVHISEVVRQAIDEFFQKHPLKPD